jgi:hypothetical protein
MAGGKRRERNIGDGWNFAPMKSPETSILRASFTLFTESQIHRPEAKASFYY